MSEQKHKPTRDLTPNQRLKLLTTPNWTYKEIMQYFRWGRNKAIQVKMDACKKGGAIRFHSDQVLSKVVLELQGIDKEEEIKLCMLANKEEN